jgi:hypothetical protein
MLKNPAMEPAVQTHQSYVETFVLKKRKLKISTHVMEIARHLQNPVAGNVMTNFQQNVAKSVWLKMKHVS